MSVSTTTSSPAPAQKPLEYLRAEAAHKVIVDQMQVLFQNIHPESPSATQHQSLSIGASIFISASNTVFSPEAKSELPKYREVVPSEFVKLYEQASTINDEFFRIAKAAREFRLGFNLKEDPNLDKFKVKIETLISENNKNVDSFIAIKEALQKALQSLKDDINELNEKEIAPDIKKHFALVLKINPETIDAHAKIAQEENQARTNLKNKITNIIDTITSNASRILPSGSRYQIWRLTEGYKQGGSGSAMNNETLFALGTYWYDPKYATTKFVETKSVETGAPEAAKVDVKPEIKTETKAESKEMAPAKEEVKPTLDLKEPQLEKAPLDQKEELALEAKKEEVKDAPKVEEKKKNEFPPLSTSRPDKPSKKKVRTGTDG